MSNSVALPKRSANGAARYDLCVSQNCTILAKGKGLVQTRLTISFPIGLYPRIAPRSRLALKEFIDVGVGVADLDYRGEVGVVLFNHGDQDFEVKMGDRIAELIFKKIRTPEVVEVAELEDTVSGVGGFGSIGVNEKNDTDEKKEMKGKNERIEKKNEEVKNKTLQGSDRDKRRTEKRKKSAGGTS